MKKEKKTFAIEIDNLDIKCIDQNSLSEIIYGCQRGKNSELILRVNLNFCEIGYDQIDKDSFDLHIKRLHGGLLKFSL